MIRKAFIRLLDSLSAWLDRWIAEDMKKKGIVPAPRSAPPGPKTARLPDGCFAATEIILPAVDWEQVRKHQRELNRLMSQKVDGLATPDRPAPDPFLEKARAEISSITGPEVAAHIPREDQ